MVKSSVGKVALAKEENIIRRQAEEALFAKELARLLVRGIAGHDEKGQRGAVSQAGGEDLLGVDLEERFSAHGADRVHPLGMIEAEPTALPTGDEENGDFAVAQSLFSALAGGGAVG